MAGRKGKNIFDQGQRLGDAAEEQETGERIGRELARNGSRGEQGAKLGSEREAFLSLRIVERLDAQRIAGHENEGHGCEVFAQIEQGKRKHAAQFVEQVFAHSSQPWTRISVSDLVWKRWPARVRRSRSSR